MNKKNDIEPTNTLDWIVFVIASLACVLGCFFLCIDVVTSPLGRGILGLATATMIILTLRETLNRRRPKDETPEEKNINNTNYMLQSSIAMLFAHLMSIIFIFRVDGIYIYFEINEFMPAAFCIAWSIFFATLSYICLIVFLFLRNEKIKKESWTTLGTHNNMCLIIFGVTTGTLLLYILLFKLILE